jgi:hypothetical protein
VRIGNNPTQRDRIEMKKIKVLLTIIVLILGTSSFLQPSDGMDYMIAKERNRTILIAVTILGITIGGSIIYATIYKKRK